MLQANDSSKGEITRGFLHMTSCYNNFSGDEYNRFNPNLELINEIIYSVTGYLSSNKTKAKYGVI